MDAASWMNGVGRSQSKPQSQSPLPDSNRRPLPYHGGPAIAANPLQKDKTAVQRRIASPWQPVATGTFRRPRYPLGTRALHWVARTRRRRRHRGRSPARAAPDWRSALFDRPRMSCWTSRFRRGQQHSPPRALTIEQSRVRGDSVRPLALGSLASLELRGGAEVTPARSRDSNGRTLVRLHARFGSRSFGPRLGGRTEPLWTRDARTRSRLGAAWVTVSG